jgi:hypothetical protein
MREHKKGSDLSTDGKHKNCNNNYRDSLVTGIKFL